MENCGECGKLMDLDGVQWNQFSCAFNFAIDVCPIRQETNYKTYQLPLLMKDFTSSTSQLFIDPSIANILTIERVRKCKKFENVTDEEALHIIHTLSGLCTIAARIILQIPEAA